jgi:hypothetical protein
MEHIPDSIRANTVKNETFKKIENFHFWSIFANFMH